MSFFRFLTWFSLGALLSSLAGSWSWFVPTAVMAYLAFAVYGWLMSTLTLIPAVRRALPGGHQLQISQRRIAQRNFTRAWRFGQYLRWPAYTLRAPRHFLSPVLRRAIVGGRDLPKWFRMSMVMDPADELKYASTGAWLAFLSMQWDLGGFDGAGWFLPTVAWAVGIALGGRHASYLLGQPDLAERARQGFGNPYLSYLRISVIDYVAAVPVLVWLNGGRLVDLDTGQLAGTAKTLLQPADVLAVLTGLPEVQPTPSGVAAFALTALFSASTVAGLLRVRAFQRTDDDRVMLAVHALAHGEPREAQAQIQQVRRTNAQTLGIQAAVAVAQGDPDEAWRLMELQDSITGAARTHLHKAIDLSMAVGNALLTEDDLLSYLLDLRRRGLPEMAMSPAMSLAWVNELHGGDARTWWLESELADRYPVFTAGYLELPVDGPAAALKRLESAEPIHPIDIALALLCRLKITRVAQFTEDEVTRQRAAISPAEWLRLASSCREIETVALGSVLMSTHAVLDMHEPTSDTSCRLVELIHEIQASASSEGLGQIAQLRQAYPSIRWPEDPGSQASAL